MNISVYHDDGSVAVAHGGIEMGQGMNTKVAQVVAKELGVDMDMIRVKPSNNFANVNGSVTGGGMGSECNCSVKFKDGTRSSVQAEIVRTGSKSQFTRINYVESQF